MMMGRSQFAIDALGRSFFLRIVSAELRAGLLIRLPSDLLALCHTLLLVGEILEGVAHFANSV